MEVLRAEVDWGGYDLVLGANGVLRYLQLKASHTTAKAREVKINTNLERKPGGCVIWMRYDPATLKLGPFFWFGGKPREAMPSLGEKIAFHTKGNKEGVKRKDQTFACLRLRASKSCTPWTRSPTRCSACRFRPALPTMPRR